MKITVATYLRTYPLTTNYITEALQRSGEALPGINGVNDIVFMFRNNHSPYAIDLCPFVKKTYHFIPLQILNS